METAALYQVELELRQEGDRPTLTGRFPYGATATLAATGRVRKERFGSRAFAFAVNAPEREIHFLIGHDFGKPLARKLNGSLELTDADDALTFRAILPPESEQPTYMRDFLLEYRAGLVGGLSPGFQVPPASAVPNAERLTPEAGNPGVSIRDIAAAVLYEMSGVTRPTFPGTELEMRAAGLYVPTAPDPRLRLL